jgi:hypothetical protein
MRRRAGTRPNNRRRARPLLEALEGRQLLTGPQASISQDIQKLQDLQSAEAAIAVQHARLNVGTFNAATGFFTGLGGPGPDDTSYFDLADPGGNEGPIMKPRHIYRPHESPTEAFINAVDVGLTFSVSNTNGGFSVTANNHTVSAGPGQNSLTVEVGTDSQVAYTVTAGNASYSGQFSIIRPPHIAVGTIPLIPLGVIYDVPQGQAGKNQIQLTTTSGTTTTVSVSFSQENSSSTEVPWDVGLTVLSSVKTIADTSSKVLGNFKAHLSSSQGDQTSGNQGTTGGDQSSGGQGTQDVSKLIGNIGNWVSDIALGSSIISNLLGSTDTTKITGGTIEQDTSDSLTITTSGTYIPGTKMGPGNGDLIRYLQNAQMVGIGWNGQVTMAPLPGLQVRQQSVYFLKQRLKALGTSNAPDPVTGLDRTSILALLALDPLAGGGVNASLDSSRFVKLGNYGVNGGTDTETFTSSSTQSQTDTNTETTSTVQTDKAGWLGFLGIGVTDNNTTKTTVTNKTSTKQDSTRSVAATLTLVAGANEYYTVDVYYDTLFGTLLVRKVGPSLFRAPARAPVAFKSGGHRIGVIKVTAPPKPSAPTYVPAAPAAPTPAPVTPPARPIFVASDRNLPAIRHVERMFLDDL